MIEQTTIVALSTPPGSGALGVIRLSGSEAIAIVDSIFKGKKLAKQTSHTIYYGKIVDAETVIDEVVVALFKNPKSFTGEHVIEISCHGSAYILQKVIELCLNQGATLAEPGEFTMRAFLNGKMDLTEAEAVADLIASDTQNAHQMAMHQMRGGFSNNIKELRKRLIKFASLIELELDFGEEDVEFADRTELKNLLLEIQTTISQLLQSFQLGNVFKNGVNTVIAGRPNAGKSTLLNTLLQEERAIVSNIPGTTRDSIEAIININGIKFRLIDTAGIREAKDTIEKIGIQRTFEAIEKASILIYVYDYETFALNDLEKDIKELQHSKAQIFCVANKLDLTDGVNDKLIAALEERLPNVTHLGISALKNENIDRLKKIISKDIASLQKGDTIVSNIRHFQHLKKANEYLEIALQNLEQGISGDLIALDIRATLQELGSIIGEVSTDDLLTSIFRDFCIGK